MRFQSASESDVERIAAEHLQKVRSGKKGQQAAPPRLQAPPDSTKTDVELVHVTCPQCSAKLRTKATLAGKRIKCPKCGQGVSVPGPPPAVGLAPAKPQEVLSIQARRRVVLEGHDKAIKHLAISPDSKVLAATNGAWRLPQGEPLGILNERTYYEVSSLAITTDSRLLFAAGHDDNKPAMMRLWSLPEGELLGAWEGPQNYTRCAAFTPDGKLLVTGTYPWASGEHFLRLWSMPDGALLKTLKGHADQVKQVAITPNGKHVVSGDDKGVVRIWCLPEGNMLARCRTDEPNGIGCLAISPDGRLAADGTHSWVRLWSVPDGRLLKQLELHAFWIRALAFSPDGKFLAGCGASETIRVWRLPDGEVLRDLKGHQADVTCLAISADSRFLASGSEDQDVILWNLANGARLTTLEDHPGHVASLAIAPDGKTVAVGSKDGSVTLWDITVQGGSALSRPSAHSCLAMFMFNSDAISSAGSANYGSYVQGQVLKALGAAAVNKAGWSAFPRLMRCCDGDLFERSMMGETPALAVLQDWISRGQHRLDVSKLDGTFLGRLKSQSAPGFIPYAIAIGPMPLGFAAGAHQWLHTNGATGYLGLLTLDGAKDILSLDAELHIPHHITIAEGRVTGAQASKEDVRQAGLS